MSMRMKLKIALVVVGVIANEIALRWAKRELARQMMASQRVRV